MTRSKNPAIALKASTDTGGFYFIYLYTIKRMNRCIWYELPLYNEVKIKVEEFPTGKY